MGFPRNKFRRDSSTAIPASPASLAKSANPAIRRALVFGCALACICGLFLAGCGGGEGHSGVVSETTNGLAGKVVDTRGGSAASARVSWKPAGYLPGVGTGEISGALNGADPKADTGSVVTDGEGRFRIMNLPVGSYLLDIRGSKGEAASVRYDLKARASVDSLPDSRLEATGSLRMTFASTVIGPVLIRVYGTDLSLRVDARDTAVLEGLASGQYRVRASGAGADASGKGLDLVAVPVGPGALTRIGGVDPASGLFEITPPSRFAADSMLAHAFLQRSGALKRAPFDSLVRRRGQSISAIILSGIALDSLPASVGGLRFLDSLWINACGLKSIPDSLYTLDSLASLNLAYNFGLRPAPALWGMASLAHLDLSGLGFQTLDTLPTLPGRLRELLLNGNPLIRAPGFLTALPALEIISMQDCGLDSVPAALFAGTRLRQLFLGGNRLVTLPDVFTPGHAMEKLFLDRNLLRELPASLRALGGLKVLRLKGNGLCNVPADMEAFILSVPSTDDPLANQTGC